MKLIVDISEELYKDIMLVGSCQIATDVDHYHHEFEKMIRTGIPVADDAVIITSMQRSNTANSIKENLAQHAEKLNYQFKSTSIDSLDADTIAEMRKNVMHNSLPKSDAFSKETLAMNN